MRFLVCIGGSFFAICLLDSFFAKTQANWPAPSYFTLLILTGYFIATHWRLSWGWLIAAMIFGLAMQPILHDMTRLYPLAPWLNRHFPKPAKEGEPRYWQAKNLDAEYKMRGIGDPFASTVAADLATLPAGSFVLCEAYEDASQLAFYLPGQPRTYFAGSYWTQPFPIRRRWTQFDIWPDRALDRPELKGKDAIYIGTMAYQPLRQSFASVRQLPDITVRLRGVYVTSWTVWKCEGFKGMKRPPDDGTR